MKSAPSVAHLTSVHKRNDPRIFLKECRSLARNNIDVSLIVADGNGDCVIDDVKIYDVGCQHTSRIKRAISTGNKILRKAIEIDSDIFHIHDSELLRIGVQLKKLGKIVIYDSHEHLPKQIRDKEYIPAIIKGLVSSSIGHYELRACRQFDAVVAATDHIRDRFIENDCTSVTVKNFAIIDSELPQGSPYTELRDVCYIGSITKLRGIVEVVESLNKVDNGVRLQLGGTFPFEETKAEVMELEGWQRVDELGWLTKPESKEVLRKSFAGIVTLHPVNNYIDALPVKLFEYMNAGIPVIASNIPFWGSIVEENKCGICVDPKSPQQIAEAINYLNRNREIAKKMGDNGRKAAFHSYNWKSEETELIKLYDGIISKR